MSRRRGRKRGSRKSSNGEIHDNFDLNISRANWRTIETAILRPPKEIKARNEKRSG